ncbi:MAG: PcfJ domain-containing protein [Acidimicrobiia bacterium]|nr:PcfJ domain-containing protein [Acidimicrobiia bacterium]
MTAELLCEGVWWTDEADASVVAVEDEGRREPRLRVSRAGARVRAELLFLSGKRAVDLSTRPAAVLDVLAAAAGGFGPDGGDRPVLAERLHRRSREWQTWAPGAGTDTGALAALGGMTHPVLGFAYDAGVRPAGEIPLWASPALGQESAVDAARMAFGPKATRPVMRAFVGCMAPSPDASEAERPEVQWWQVGVALAGARVLEPDHLAAVMSTPARPVGTVPTNDDVADMRRALELLGPSVAARLAVDALGRDTGRHLLGILRLFLTVHRDLERQPPSRLDRLERDCLAVARVDPGPRRPYPQCGTAPPPRPRANAEAAPDPETAALAIPRLAPPVRRRVLPPRFEYPPRIADLHGTAIGELTLVLPWSAHELTVWGRSQQNCLGGFGLAVAAGMSVVVGVRRGRQLVAALELRPESRTIMQFLGPHNRPVPAGMARPVITYLRLCGLVDSPVGSVG